MHFRGLVTTAFDLASEMVSVNVRIRMNIRVAVRVVTGESPRPLHSVDHDLPESEP